VIVPSIDVVAGRAVQLIGGETEAVDGGDPSKWMERFRLVGEVAVVDIDAARGDGENHEVIARLCDMGRVRVGGGIRDVETATGWLDRGAEKVVIGTAAEEDLLARLPRDRVIVALDARHGEVLTHGWRTASGRGLLESITRLRRLCGGFLVTFVEREGRLGGTDLEMAERVVTAADPVPVTIAGGISTASEIAALDRLGADAQVGMALYTGQIGLADAITSPLRSDREDGLWPTVIVDESGTALGLAWSSRESIGEAVETRRGVYQSRSRGRWVKGETSGAVQELVAVDADCDRDALRFTVRQVDGFCHRGTRSCWGDDRGISRLARRLLAIADAPVSGSNTARLLDDPTLLAGKLIEEAGELARAAEPGHIVEEIADLVYFALVKAASAGLDLEQVEEVLDRRERRVTRRPMSVRDPA
jgi:phosphoribosyl-ATP pyrophosphohydrolase